MTKFKITYCCKDCGTLIVKTTALYGLGRCKKCRGLQMVGIKKPLHSKKMMGKNNSNWKGGLANCIICGKKLCNKKCKYCIACWKKINTGKQHFSYRGVKEKRCIDCDKQLNTYNKVLRCRKCEDKHKCGKNHPFFGKTVPPPRFVFYKNRNFRSSWEANFAKWCDGSGIKWKYEPKAFELYLNNKNTTYTPDFYLSEFDCYVEIKGYWQFNAKDKVTLFRKKYPEINYKLYFKKELQELGIL